MADNTGPYIKYGDFLLGLSNAGDSNVTKLDITLSNKVVDSGGDIFEYNMASGSPIIGDVVTQAGNVVHIISVLTGPDRIVIEETGDDNQVLNGVANLLHSDSYDRKSIEKEIKTASSFIDYHTRQFFNSRSKTIRLEGNNSNVLLFPIPIISVSEVRLNDDTVGTDLTNFEFFNNRGNIPDDRRNPRIKIFEHNRNIFRGSLGRAFLRGTMTEIDGYFGFIDEDGSTPALIQKAVNRMVISSVSNPISTTSTGGLIGPKKSERVDLHETEYYQPDDVQGGPSGKISGDVEVDRIINMFRSPIAIGGSILDNVEIQQQDYLYRDGYHRSYY